MHIALGGCLKGPPVAYGLTGDTGGHIAYVLGAATTQAKLDSVASITILTRSFDGDGFDPAHSTPIEGLCQKTIIRRIATGTRGYLEKEALAQDLPAFIQATVDALADPFARPDIVHAHFADAASVALALRDRYGIPFVYTPHSLALQKPGSAVKFSGRIGDERRAIELSDAIVVSSRDEAECQVAAYGVAGASSRVLHLPPGPPLDEPETKQRSALDLLVDLVEPTRPMILAIARPMVRKNLVALAEAFALCPSLSAKANLVLLAGQPERSVPCAEEAGVAAALDVALADPYLQGRVARLGHHSHADVQALYRFAVTTGGVFVNCALHEPFGLTLLEAAAAGLPVVATRNGGPMEIVEAIGHGILIDPEDREGIAHACMRIVTDRVLHRALAKAALNHDHHYSWDRYARGSVDLYAAVLASAFRRARPPRLVACDIDDTLTGCKAGASRFAAWAAVRRDTGFIVATGRSFDQARAILACWDLPTPDAFITAVGTVMHRRAASGHFEPCVEFSDGLDVDWDRAGVAATLERLRLVSQGIEEQGQHKLSYFASAAEAEAVRGVLSKAGFAARVVHSHAEYLDVLAPRAGKGAAVEAYAHGLGLTLKDCIAAGDSGNDADMLEACGFAIVVGNASAELDELTPRVGLYRAEATNADGVLEGLAAAELAFDRPSTVSPA